MNWIITKTRLHRISLAQVLSDSSLGPVFVIKTDAVAGPSSCGSHNKKVGAHFAKLSANARQLRSQLQCVYKRADYILSRHFSGAQILPRTLLRRAVTHHPPSTFSPCRPTVYWTVQLRWGTAPSSSASTARNIIIEPWRRTLPSLTSQRRSASLFSPMATSLLVWLFMSTLMASINAIGTNAVYCLLLQKPPMPLTLSSALETKKTFSKISVTLFRVGGGLISSISVCLPSSFLLSFALLTE
jgi:hypothetical protein